MPTLYVLGSGGWVPTPARQTCCHLLETRRALFFFDCGTGLARLHDPLLRSVLARADKVAILLSHFHHDHVAGLHYLPFFFREKEVVVATPPASVTGHPGAAVLERFGSKPLLPLPLESWPEDFARGFSIVELAEGTSRIFGEPVRALAQPHSDPSVAIRVRDVTYVTDTRVRDETVAFAAGSRILLHDAWLDETDRAAGHEDLAHHGDARGAAGIAKRAEVEKLLLVHLNPRYDETRLEEMTFDAASVFPNTFLATDLFVLDAARVQEDEGEAGSAPEGPAPAAGHAGEAS